MDAKNYGLSTKSHLNYSDTLLPDPCTMGVPSPYVQPQINLNFIAQECVQERVEHEKTLTPPATSYCDERSRTPINCRSYYAKDLSTGTVISNEEYSDFEEMIASKDLPEELASQFSARHCDLCVVQMNSALQSRMHYHGRQHQKKVKFFMSNWIKEHGGKYYKNRRDDAIDCMKTPDDKRLYCECCDLSFTSHLHAQQHYRGRNHQRVLNGLQPLKSGYFNKLTCKWQRFPPLETGNGVVARHSEPIISQDSLSSEHMNHSLGMPSEKREDQEARRGRFFCELCNIGATSQEQLDMHIKGGKHKKAERVFQQFDSLMEDGDVVKVPPADSILASVTKESNNSKKTKVKDYSIYRTPSGKFYCQLCNLTVQCESQFIQHLDSKKHRITTGPKKSSTSGFNH